MEINDGSGFVDYGRTMPRALSGHNLLKLNSTHLFLVNGLPYSKTNAYIYDIAADVWTQQSEERNETLQYIFCCKGNYDF